MRARTQQKKSEATVKHLDPSIQPLITECERALLNAPPRTRRTFKACILTYLVI